MASLIPLNREPGDDFGSRESRNPGGDPEEDALTQFNTDCLVLSIKIPIFATSNQ